MAVDHGHFYRLFVGGLVLLRGYCQGKPLPPNFSKELGRLGSWTTCLKSSPAMGATGRYLDSSSESAFHSPQLLLIWGTFSLWALISSLLAKGCWAIHDALEIKGSELCFKQLICGSIFTLGGFMCVQQLYNGGN